jgi:hypothetical protein
MVSELSGLEFDPRSPHFLIKKVEFKHMIGGSMHYPRFKPKWTFGIIGYIESTNHTNHPCAFFLPLYMFQIEYGTGTCEICQMKYFRLD